MKKDVIKKKTTTKRKRDIKTDIREGRKEAGK